MGNNIVEHTLNKVVFLDRDGTLNEEVNSSQSSGWCSDRKKRLYHWPGIP